MKRAFRLCASTCDIVGFLSVQIFYHMIHTKMVFSPVCVRMCCARFDFCLNLLPHNSHERVFRLYEPCTVRTVFQIHSVVHSKEKEPQMYSL